MKRGYLAIGIYNGKTIENIGTLWRSAHNFGADYIFTIGDRYTKQRTNTTKAEKHIPLFHYVDWKDFIRHLPENSEVVCVEQIEGAVDLKRFNHPERGVYVLGAEDKGIPSEVAKGYRKVFIDTPICLNVAVAG